MISYLSQTTNHINFDIIKIHKGNSLVEDLIYQIFEDKTINSVYYNESLTISPANLISDYIRDCCQATFDICNQSYFSTPDLEDILPPDKIIQDYMAYLVGKHITNMQSIDKEFKEYEMKLEAKMDDPDLMYLLEAVGFYSKAYSDKDYFYNPFNRLQKIKDLEIKAPFPILDMFRDMFQELFHILSMKINTLVLQMILHIGDICDIEQWIDEKTGELQLDDEGPPMRLDDVPDLNTGGFSDAIEPIVQDKKFKTMVDSIQGEYRIGLEVFKEGKLVGKKKPT